MLMQLGSVTFEVWPFNADAIDRDTGYDFVAKDVMGGMRPLEAMGESTETISIAGRLFPEKFGGLDSMDALHAMRKSGTAQILVRGDGLNMGWFVIERVSERSDFLDARGVGKRIDFQINLTRAPKPTAASYILTLLRLLT